MGFLGWDEDDEYESFTQVAPVFDEADPYMKKTKIYTALTKYKADATPGQYVELYRSKGKLPLREIFRKSIRYGNKKDDNGNSIFSGSPSIEITLNGFDSEALQKYIEDEIEGCDININSISSTQVRGKIYAKYLLATKYNYNEDTDTLLLGKRGNRKIYKFKSYGDSVTDRKMIITMTTLSSYWITRVKEYTYGITDIIDSTKNIDALKNKTTKYKRYYKNGTTTKTYSRGDVVQIPSIKNTQIIRNEYSIATIDGTLQIRTVTTDSEGKYIYGGNTSITVTRGELITNPLILERNEIEYTEYTVTKTTEEVTIRVIKYDEISETYKILTKVTVPSLKFNLSIYQATKDKYSKTKDGKVFLVDIISGNITQGTVESEYEYTYNVDDESLADYEYVPDRETKDQIMLIAKQLIADNVPEELNTTVISSTKITQENEDKIFKFSYSDDYYLLVSYRNDDDAILKYFYISYVEARELGLMDKNSDKWSNNNKVQDGWESLDALPYIQIKSQEGITSNFDNTGRKLLKKLGIDKSELYSQLQSSMDYDFTGDDDNLWGDTKEILFMFGANAAFDWSKKTKTVSVRNKETGQMEDKEITLEGPFGLSKYLYIFFNRVGTRVPPKTVNYVGEFNRLQASQYTMHIYEYFINYHFHNWIHWNVGKSQRISGNVSDYFKNDPRFKNKMKKGFCAHIVKDRVYTTKIFRYYHIHKRTQPNLSTYIEWDTYKVYYVDGVIVRSVKTGYCKADITNNYVSDKIRYLGGHVSAIDISPYVLAYESILKDLDRYADNPFYAQIYLIAEHLMFKAGTKQNPDFKIVDDSYNKIEYYGDYQDINDRRPLRSRWTPLVRYTDTWSKEVYEGEGDSTYWTTKTYSAKRYRLANLATKNGENYRDFQAYYSDKYQNYDMYEKQEWITKRETSTKPCLYLYYQEDTNVVHRLEIEALDINIQVHRGDGDAFHTDNVYSKKVCIPLIYFPIREMNLKECASLYSRCYFLQMHTVIHNAYDWYESNSFMSFVQPFAYVVTFIVTVVITICTWYLGGGPGAAFGSTMFGLLAGLTTTQVVIVAIVMAAIITASSYLISQVQNPIARTILSAIVAIAAAYVMSGFSFTNMIMSITENLFTFACNVIKVSLEIVKILVDGQSQAIQDDILELQSEGAKRQKEIEDAQTAQMQSDLITPSEMAQMNANQSSGDVSIITPDQYLYMARDVVTDMEISVSKFIDNSVSNYATNAVSTRL